MDSETNRAAPVSAEQLAAIIAAIPTARIPLATYRVQLRPEFGFHAAAELAGYLEDLGVDTLYASPHFAASPGSQHGYDVINPSSLSPELGGEKGYAELHTALKDHNLGMLIDIVPNHMGIAGGVNRFWQHVLENGRTSRYAPYFDIEWESVKLEQRGKVVLPVLGEFYGVVLENGELQLGFTGDAFQISYYGLPLPIAPPTYGQILETARGAIEAAYPPFAVPILEFASILAAFDRLPPNSTTDDELIEERRREQVITKRRLAALAAAEAPILQAIEGAVATINGVKDDPRSFDHLDALLDAQSYRLAFWRVAAEEINYRRFFAINELAAIRQEFPEVFAATHDLVYRLIADGTIDGLRIDHPDGLWNPGNYFRELQQLAFMARAETLNGDSDTWPTMREALDDWWQTSAETSSTGTGTNPIYTVIEKILQPDEQLPPDWPVSGSVGYEFARMVTGLFVDPSGERGFDQWYERFTEDDTPFEQTVYDAKQLIMREALSSELNVLAYELNRLSERRRRTRDFTLNNLRFALREIIAGFPIYRTYITEAGIVTSADRKAIDRAVQEARRRNPASERRVFDFVRDMLLGREQRIEPEDEVERLHFVMRFQQLTSPVMAKGLEDTAFYRYHRLIALNEVGGEPAEFGVEPDEFHRQNQFQQKHWPHGLLSSSTHDTKRSEDVRARLVTLSEFPREWRAAVNRWSKLNRKHRTRFGGVSAPSRTDEALFYETLVGIWPMGADRADNEIVERICAYLQKAVREGQLNSSWIAPDESYEGALEKFVRRSLDAKISGAFLDDFVAVNREIERAGAFTSLAMQTLKLTSPGVPDIYQGTECWDFSLVDPDNRREVDFDARRTVLNQLSKPSDVMISELVGHVEDGAIKLFLTSRLLNLRKQMPDLFLHGSYMPITVTGELKNHILAYARTWEEELVIVVVPRLIRRILRKDEAGWILPESWGNTRLDLGDIPLNGVILHELFTNQMKTVDSDGRPEIGDLLADFPIAVLTTTQGNGESR